MILTNWISARGTDVSFVTLQKSQQEEYVGKKVLDTKLNVKCAGRLEFELSTWGKVDFPVSIGGIFIPMPKE